MLSLTFGEGGGPPKSIADLVEDTDGMVEDLFVREAEHDDAALSEEGVAKSITPLAAVMRRAVDLDGELD